MNIPERPPRIQGQEGGGAAPLLCPSLEVEGEREQPACKTAGGRGIFAFPEHLPGTKQEFKARRPGWESGQITAPLCLG